jgi:peptidoglycan/LPS O-acetylase OafA/YrhL
VTVPERWKGPLLFVTILTVVAVVSFAAYLATGPMGMEERYSKAVGLPQEGAGEGAGWLGFSIEGDPARYMVIFGTLGILCIAGFVWSRRKGTG